MAGPRGGIRCTAPAAAAPGLWWLVAALAGQYGALVATVMAAVPQRVAGLAGGLFTTAQQVSLALGVVTIGGIPGALAPSLGWRHAFAAGLGVQVVTTVLFWALARAGPLHSPHASSTHHQKKDVHQ